LLNIILIKNLNMTGITMIGTPMIESIIDLHLTMYNESINMNQVKEIYRIDTFTMEKLTEIKRELVRLHHANMMETVGDFIVEL
tara:strand:- start:331 stop:582 length:252 start_codon:yes stop_codon:yes gene_type:complete